MTPAAPVPAANFGRYLGASLGFGLFLLALIGLWSGRSIQGSQQFYRLYLHQIDKLAASDPVATVFLGDSSLGNAIDANLFGTLEHSTAINLALTGSYGYAGSYNMLQRVLKRYTPRNVVIVQTADMMKRESDGFAYLMSADSNGLQLPDRFAVGAIANAFPEYLKLLYGPESLRRALLHTFGADGQALNWPNDYAGQRAPLHVTAQLIAEQSLAPGINPDKLFFLEEIYALCKSKGLNCVYAHGPLLQPLCAASAEYLVQASRAIRGVGIPLVARTPLCVPPFAIGDSVDHVAPAFKAQATRYYYESLAPLLK